MTRPGEPRWCHDTSCATRVILARRAFTGSWMAFEAADQPPFSEHSAGAYVLVAGQAYRPAELIEDFQVRFEIADDKARDLVSGYPFHRAHMHEIDPTSGGARPPITTGVTASKEPNRP